MICGGRAFRGCRFKWLLYAEAPPREGEGPQENLTPREADEAKIRAAMTAEAMGKGGKPDLA
eukprot:10113967-Alexandrium_andersonii.AAC.1